MKGKLIIGVTGTPASGKTEFARALSKKAKIIVVELNDIIASRKSFYRKAENGELVVNLKPLELYVKREICRKDVILVGHLAQELRLPYSMIIVTRAEMGDMYKRLVDRGYNREKIRENMVCEAVDYCGVMARRACRDVYEAEGASEKKAIISALAKKRAPPSVLKREKSRAADFAAFIKRHRGLGF